MRIKKQVNKILIEFIQKNTCLSKILLEEYNLQKCLQLCEELSKFVDLILVNDYKDSTARTNRDYYNDVIEHEC